LTLKSWDRGIFYFSLKIMGSELEDTWHHHEGCVQVKQNCEGVNSVSWTKKNLDHFAFRGMYLLLVLWHFSILS
jgi:hypothetical protein